MRVAPASPSVSRTPENESRKEAEEAASRGSAAEDDGPPPGGSRPLSYAGALGVDQGRGAAPAASPPGRDGPGLASPLAEEAPPYLSVAAGASREVSAPRASARSEASIETAPWRRPRRRLLRAAARPRHRRRLSDDFPDTLAPTPASRDRYLRGGEGLRPYRDALLPPPRERGERGDMLAQVLAHGGGGGGAVAGVDAASESFGLFRARSRTPA